MKTLGYLSAIDEFETKGFVKSSSHHNCYLIKRMRMQYGEYFNTFSVGHKISASYTGAKYGAFEIFGERVTYYYDIRRKKEFVDFLVSEFYKKNPDPDKIIRKTFTRILHIHQLHWSGCAHGEER